MSLKPLAIALLASFLLLSIQPALAENGFKAYLNYDVRITPYGSVIEKGTLILSNPSTTAMAPQILIGYPESYKGKVVDFSSPNSTVSFDEEGPKVSVNGLELPPSSNVTVSWTLATRGLLSSEIGLKYRAELALIPSTNFRLEDVKVNVTAPSASSFERVEGFNVTDNEMVGEFEGWKGLKLENVTLNLPSRTDDLILLEFSNVSRTIEVKADGVFVSERFTIRNLDHKDLNSLKVRLLSNTSSVYLVDEFEPFRSQPVEIPVEDGRLSLSSSGFVISPNETLTFELEYGLPSSYLKDGEITVPKGSAIDEPIPYEVSLKLDPGFKATSKTTYRFSPLDVSGCVTFRYSGGPNPFKRAVPYVTTFLFLAFVSFLAYLLKGRKPPEELQAGRVKGALRDLISLLDGLESLGTEKVKKKDIARYNSDVDAGVSRVRGEFRKLLKLEGREAEFGRIDSMLKELERKMKEYGAVFERFSGKRVRERRVRKLLDERRERVLSAYESLLDELEKTI